MVCLTVAMVMLLSFAGDAMAQAGGGHYESTVKSRCQQIKQEVISQDKDKAYLVEYIVKCTKAVVREAFQKFLQGFYPAVFRAGRVVLVLAVTIFGVMLATGAIEKSSRDSFVLLFKLGCVLFFIKPDTVNQLFNMGMDSMDGLTDMVFQYGKGGNSGRCFDNDTLWDRLDCTLDVLIGTVKDTGSGGAALQGVSRGSMHFFASSIASTSVGAIIGMLGFYVTYTILMATIKSIHTYLAAIIALAFILMFAPMFVPMIMFKVTRTYFDKWMRIATSFILQPVILFGFLSLMLIAMETMMLTGEGSLMKTIMGPEGDQKNKFVSEALEKQGAFGSKMFQRLFDVGDSSRLNLTKETDTGVTGDRAKDSRADSGGDAATKGMNSMNTTWDKVQFDKLGKCGSAEKCQEKIAMVTLTMALTAFVFISMLNYIPNLATDLSGGIYEVPSLYKVMGSKLPGGDMTQKMMQGFTNKGTERMRGYTNKFRSEVEKMVGVRK